jgi:cytochrome c-type biogenesis protein CcmH
MSLFWIFAMVLLIVAFGFAFLPLNRLKEKNGNSTMLVIVLVVPLASVLLYQAFSNFDPKAVESSVGSVEDMVTTLESRLVREGGSTEEWFMLGRSYVSMGRFEEAAPVFARVNEMTNGEDSAVLIAYAESLALSDRASLTGLGAELLNKALTIDPLDARGLWWGGVSAMESGDNELAAQRWQELLKQDPPEALANTVREQLSRIGVQAAPPIQAADDGISVRITVSDELAKQVSPGMVLYLFARDPGAAGPPLAVVRHVASDLPLAVQLTQSNVMLATTVLADHAELQLVARISRSGNPGAQPGDFFGEVLYRTGSGTVDLVIDEVVP